ncbi:AGAP003086-PA-like protein [Anopheles sinensis]|uniref:AGAP003086-PA-like protein n=1 Tax=Anopheles sinensis TaxID=74873 RepID=A0A084W914_ANOSI|nr:AGAP003086-PA-like protein [Anopheles sinensis]
MSKHSASTSQTSAAKLLPLPEMGEDRTRFRPVFVILLISGHLLFAVLIVTVGITVSSLGGQSHDGDLAAAASYFIIVYLRVVYWLLTYVVHECHKREFGRLAEPDFDRYRALTVYRKAPLQIASLWNVILLAVQNQVRYLFPHQTDHDGMASGGGALNPAITPQVFVIVVCALELLVLLCFYVPLVRALIDIRQAEGHGKETDLRYRRMTETELQEQPVEWQLDRQAVLIKRLRTERDRLQREAKSFGVDRC